MDCGDGDRADDYTRRCHSRWHHMTAGGTRWMNTLVSLSKSCHTALFRHATVAHASGPKEHANATFSTAMGSSVRLAGKALVSHRGARGWARCSSTNPLQK